MSILSVDSMAVYKGLDILTAKPSQVMQAQVKYYGIDIADPDQNFSVVDYLNYLIEQNIPEKSFNEDILAVGGSGLYVKAMIDGMNLSLLIQLFDQSWRLNFDQLKLFHQLNEIPLPDVELNKRRLIRNIEDFILESQNMFSELCIPDNYAGVFWNHPDYKINIEKRTNHMINNGLLEEVNNLQNPSKTVLQAIGLNLSEDYEENINIKTKRLAKKQITWFKKESKLKMLTTDNSEVVYEEIMKVINE